MMNKTFLVVFVFTLLMVITQEQLICERSGSVTLGAQDTLKIASCERKKGYGACALLDVSIYEDFAFYSSTWSLNLQCDTSPCSFLKQSGGKTTTKKSLVLGDYYKDEDLELYLRSYNTVQSMTVFYQIHATYVNCSFVTPNYTTVWPAKPYPRPVKWNLDYHTEQTALLRLIVQGAQHQEYRIDANKHEVSIDDSLAGGEAYLDIVVEEAVFRSSSFKVVYNNKEDHNTVQPRNEQQHKKININ